MRTYYAIEHLGDSEVVKEFGNKHSRDIWVHNQSIESNNNLYGNREAVLARDARIQRWIRDRGRYQMKTYTKAFGRKAAKEIVDFIAGKPGIYFHIPEKIYHAHPAISNSFLADLRSDSPHYARECRENPPPNTEDMDFGTLVHYALLEPEKYEAIPSAGKCCVKYASGKREGQRCDSDGKGLYGGRWYCGTHSRGIELEIPDLILSPTDEERIDRIQDSLEEVDPDGNHGDAYDILVKRKLLSEVTVLFPHEPTGIMLRCRLDLWDRENQEVPDVKTCQSANKYNFERTITKFGYHRKMALYERALMYHGEPPRVMTLIAVEKARSFAVKPWDLDRAALDMGWIEIEEDLETLRKCQEQEYFPRLGLKRETIGLPPWAFSKIENFYTEEFS